MHGSCSRALDVYERACLRGAARYGTVSLINSLSSFVVFFLPTVHDLRTGIRTLNRGRDSIIHTVRTLSR